MQKYINFFVFSLFFIKKRKLLLKIYYYFCAPIFINMKKILLLLLCVLFAGQLSAQKGVSPLCDQAYATMKDGDYETAITMFKQDLKNNPKSGYSYWGLAITQYALGDLTEALASLDLAAKYMPKEDKFIAYRDKASVLVQMGKTQEALDCLTLGIKTNPKIPFCYLERADLYSNMEYYSLAQKDYEQVLSLNPNNQRALYGMSQVTAYTNVHEARQWIHKAIEIDRSQGYFYAWGAILAIGDSDLEEALDFLITCINYDVTGDFFNQAYYFLADTIPEEMLSRFEAQQAKQSTNVIWSNYAVALCRIMQQPHRALPYAEYAFQMTSDTNCLFLWAEAESLAGEHDKALEIWKGKALEWGVDKGNYFSIEAYLLQSAGRFEDLFAVYDSLYAVYHDDTVYHYNRAHTYMYLGQWQKALEEMTEVEKYTVGDNYVGLYNLRAAAYGLMGDTAAMQTEYRKAIEVDPDRILAWYFNGDKERAKKQIRKNYDTESTDGEVLYNIAQVYAQIGDTELAMKYLRKSFEKGYYLGRANAIMRDYELTNIRNLPEFKELMDEYAEKQKQ